MPRIRCCCRADNDLFATWATHGVPVTLEDHAYSAIDAAEEGDAVVVLAEKYPHHTANIDAATYAAAKRKGVRLLVEFPAELPGMVIGPVVEMNHERCVVTSTAFGSLSPLRILAIHGGHVQQVDAEQNHLVMARVAGFEHAEYGLPTENVWPILFEHPDQPLLVATTRLSHFITARFGPMDAWQQVLLMITRWLLPDVAVERFDWQPRVEASYERDEKLPAGAHVAAIQRASDWFFKAGMLAGINGSPRDGGCGILEGLRSKINVDGSQPIAQSRRNDCCSESAMALAVRSQLDGDERCADVARKVQDYIYGPDGFQRRSSADPHSPAFGLMSWSEGSMEVFFGDDNARSILGTIATGAALREDRWDERILQAILGNFRTSGRSACQGHNLWEPLLFKYGWEHYWDADEPRLSPHFESWLFACYLWLYDKTKFEPLLHRTRRGIGRMMAAYPHDWHWTNGLQQERARMILPLAWLVRVDDTPEHRGWLLQMAGDLLASQDACGAIREELGDPSKGLYGPPVSNEKYGSNEAPLIHNNGEPVCDLLYTTNFAFVGLVEAVAATGDAMLKTALGKLTDFLVRIQVRSPSLTQTDGAWFRSFDYRRWEHWGANADAGWGVWCVETGWTQAWITTALALRQSKTSFWDYTAGSRIGELMPRVRPMFLPDKVLARNGSKPSPRRNGEPQRVRIHYDDLWTCYIGRDLETTVDLGKVRPLKEVGADFVRSSARGLKLPGRVEFSLSDDGKSFRSAGAVTPTKSKDGHMTVHTVSVQMPGTAARYVKLRASRDVVAAVNGNGNGPVQTPDAPHGKVWLFVDEIFVQ